jgi:hypothetical protein
MGDRSGPFRRLLVAAIALGVSYACSSFEADDSGPAGGPDGSVLAEGGAGSACTDAPETPTTVATTDSGVALIAADGAYVYFAGGARVERATVANPPTVESIKDNDPTSPAATLALTAGYAVYQKKDQLVYAPKGSTAGSGVGTNLTGLIVGGADAEFYARAIDGVFRVVTPSTTPTTVVRAQAVAAFAVAGDNLAVIGVLTDGGPTQLFVTPAFSAGGPRVLELGPDLRANRVAIDGEAVFFTDRVSSSVGRAELDGGGVRVLASGQESLADIAVSGGFLYFATARGLRRIATTGGCIKVLTEAPVTAFSIAGDRVYYIDGASIKSVAK